MSGLEAILQPTSAPVGSWLKGHFNGLCMDGGTPGQYITSSDSKGTFQWSSSGGDVVSSVTAGNASITIGGTPTSPTVAVTGYQFTNGLSLGTMSGPISPVGYSVLARASNGQCTLSFPGFINDGISVSSPINFSASLPSQFLPNSDLYATSSTLISPITVLNNGSSVAGAITITSSGSISIGPGVAGGAFTSSAISTGFVSFSITYCT